MKTTTLIRLVTVTAAVLVIAAGVLYLRHSAPRAVVDTGEDCANCPGMAVAASDAGSPVTTPDSMTAAVADSGAVTTVAYYFRTTQRCASCLKIENYSHEIIEKEFAAQIQSGRLVWKMINIEEPQYKHFVDDFKLYTKALVLVDYTGGTQLRWKNCQKVWELLNDKDEFQTYVKREVQSFLTNS